MKKLLYIILAQCLLLGACHDTDVGYLKATTASYPVSTMNITRLQGVTEENNPDVYNQYQQKIEGQVPWTTSEIEGVLGTNPITYSIARVKALNGGDAAIFQKELTIRGGGRMQVPFGFSAPNGIYSVSILIENEGYSYQLDDVFIFVVE